MLYMQIMENASNIGKIMITYLVSFFKKTIKNYRFVVMK